MSILVNGNQFHLRTKNTSYIMSVSRDKYLLHHYWGEPLFEKADLSHLEETYWGGRPTAFQVPMDPEDKFFIDDLKMEFSTVGSGDWRTPSVQVKHADGSTVTEFTYEGYKIEDGKPPLCGLPATYCEAGDDVQTLTVTFVDRLSGFEMQLCYSVFYDYDVITRNVLYKNNGKQSLSLLTAHSACVDFGGTNYKLMHLHGAWLQERNVEFVDVSHGVYTVDSKYGMSSHVNNPFVALMDKNADEYTGNVYGFSLVYSGNFSADCEVSPCGTTRMTMGINSFNFDWTLESGAVFQTPEAVMVYSNNGINAMSMKYHKLYRERLMRGKYRDAVRPVLCNTWEGVHMDFDEAKVVAMAEKAAQIGCDMIVLDDGWFGKRNDDTTSIGDWYPDKAKLPNGLEGLVEKVNAAGVDFGIWFEPEMVSPDSDLYRAHPDWCMHAEGRNRTTMRNTLVLDLSLPEVTDYLYDSISKVLDGANIKYIKWDCNHYIVETQDCMQSHKFVLGLYQLLERLVQNYPDVLFESCSGGGGRFDPGMLYYMPQTWTSDNTRIPSRMDIQYGTSMVYPALAMSAHMAKFDVKALSDENHLNTVALVAMGGMFGFEVDLALASEEVLARCKEYVELYKQIQNTVLYGDMYRLESPFETDRCSWEFHDGSQALLFAFQKRNRANREQRCIKLKGLEPTALYECDGKTYYGDELMKVGVAISNNVYDYHAQLKIFKKVQ